MGLLSNLKGRLHKHLDRMSLVKVSPGNKNLQTEDSDEKRVYTAGNRQLEYSRNTFGSQVRRGNVVILKTPAVEKLYGSLGIVIDQRPFEGKPPLLYTQVDLNYPADFLWIPEDQVEVIDHIIEPSQKLLPNAKSRMPALSAGEIKKYREVLSSLFPKIYIPLDSDGVSLQKAGTNILNALKKLPELEKSLAAQSDEAVLKIKKMLCMDLKEHLSVEKVADLIKTIVESVVGVSIVKTIPKRTPEQEKEFQKGILEDFEAQRVELPNPYRTWESTYKLLRDRQFPEDAIKESLVKLFPKKGKEITKFFKKKAGN